MRPPRFYRPELDGLRFIAAALVFIHHAPALPGLGAVKAYGWLGVDLFLALSAFLITRLAMIEHQRTGTFSLRRFFIRRALRIWPLYLGFALFACAIAAAAGWVALGTAAKWALAHVSFSANILTSAAGYSPVPMTAHLWTIPLEEQAYVLIALTLSACFARAVSRQSMVGGAVAAIAALILARVALIDAPHPFVWVSLLRADAFILGALAALTGFSRRWWPLGLALIASVALFPPIGTGGAYDVLGYTVLAAGCILVIVAAPQWLGALRYLGKISYGLYVYHLAGLFAASKLASGPLAVFALGAVITIAAASLSYHLFETPFLRIKERFAVVRSRPT